MSASDKLSTAFNQLLGIHCRKVTIERKGVFAPVQIKVTPSNYNRNLAGPEEVVIKGREFVITKFALEAANFPAPRRGDMIVDPDLGSNSISEVHEIMGFGGGILGYRVRCS